MNDLPEDVSQLLDAAAPIGQADSAPAQMPELGAKFDKPALKVVEVGPEPWRDTVSALRLIADEDESGADAKIVRAAFIAQREDGSLAVHGIGPKADDLATIALISLGLQQIQSEMLY